MANNRELTVLESQATDTQNLTTCCFVDNRFINNDRDMNENPGFKQVTTLGKSYIKQPHSQLSEVNMTNSKQNNMVKKHLKSQI